MLTIVDRCFQHHKTDYTSDLFTPEGLKWARKEIGDVGPNDVVIFTDHTLQQAFEQTCRFRIAWLMEPRELVPQYYQYVEQYADSFDMILTHDLTFLSAHLNARFIPYGGCWIKPEDHDFHGKTSSVSMIASNKMAAQGHILRHEIADKIFYSSNPAWAKVDLYGSITGERMSDKIEALRDYRFSIVVENIKKEYWFTEKLIDCFVTGTIPIYYGCPSIGKFFDERGIFSFTTVNELEEILTRLAKPYGLDDHDWYILNEAVCHNYKEAKKYLLPENFIYTLLCKEGLINV